MKKPYEIKKDVPLPPKPRGGRPKKYDFEGMKIGDMILMECDPEERGKMQSRATSYVSIMNKRKGLKIKISTRQLPEGVGVWRMA